MAEHSHVLNMRFLLLCMVLAVTLTAITLLCYVFLLSSIVPTTVHSFLEVRKTNDYPVLVGSSVESHFLMLKMYNCSRLQHRQVHILWSNFYWQEVQDSKIYLYSAYYDTRFVYDGVPYHYVRVIGMSMGKIYGKTYYCSLWYKQQNDPVVLKADTSEIWVQQWNSHPAPDLYHTYLFTCPIPEGVRKGGAYPDYVSISAQPCNNVTTMVPIHREGILKSQLKKKGKYAVCVKGMDFRKDISHRLIEWLELLFILGAEKVFFYKYSVHPNIDKVLDYYTKQGKVVVLSLTLPGDQPNEPQLRSLYLKRDVWQKRRNEIVPYNDCLYRNMYLYDYIIPLDVDEVILPVKTYTWSEMFSKYKQDHPKDLERYASFSAQNAYFLEAYNATWDPDVSRNFHMLHYKTRSANFSIRGHSVKSFISTNKSLSIFNHYTLEGLYAKVKGNLVLNTSVVQMNHYKERCPRELYSKCKSNFLVYTKRDNIIEKYKKPLVDHVLVTLKKLNLLPID
ncbi:uncharacterized protein LOC134765072 [Penaeus indicus]|uniref:uncharacterized protein LOC134765072 n=1 Tax=Penaeus indicus TaxID=29960 RepID=UPI00300DB3A5